MNSHERNYLRQTIDRTRRHAVCIRTHRVHPILLDYFVLVIDFRAMGSTSMNHGDGYVGINRVKDRLMD
jgi:hypothetical protein